MVDRKFCFVVHSPVKNWFSTLSSKHCHFTILCLSSFCTILTIFEKSKYYCDVVNQQQFLNLQKIKNWVTFQIIIKISCTSAALLWGMYEGFSYKFCTKIRYGPSFPTESSLSSTYNLSQANCMELSCFW